MLFWQFHLIMQVSTNVFITAIHGLHGDTSAAAVTEGPTTSSSLPCSVMSVCAVCATGWSQWPLSFRPFYNKSIICFNKICVTMRERKDFRKALMPCRGRKIIIQLALLQNIETILATSASIWNCSALTGICLISNFFYFFAYEVIFRNVEQKKNSELMLCLLSFFLARAHTSLMEETRWSHPGKSPL